MALTETGPDRETVMTVLARDGYRCVVCSAPIEGDRGVAWALHHRRYRDGMPDMHTPQNLITVCGGSNVDRCHGLIHSGKAYACKVGWSITRHGRVDPLTVPVLVKQGSRWVYLDTAGGYADDPPQEVA